ncbi:MAG: 2-phospho-L-lactate guanylyltransferase [Candidatus Promineifilaceae bacterium]
MIIWAIVPVKPLRDSKSRLSHILSPDERAELTGYLLGRTLSILEDVRVIDRTLVVSRDPAALKIARQFGASTYGETDKQDLNVALTRASHIAAAQRAQCVLILPADLPLLSVEDVEMMIAGAVPEAMNSSGNGYFYQKRALSICTDHNSEGTNALLICPPTGFNFQFGAESFRLHLDEAERLGMSRRIVHAPGIKFDLDSDEDWKTFLTLQREPLNLHHLPQI